MLTIEQRSQIAAMTPMQQQQAWTAIEAQLASRSASTTAGTTGMNRTMPSNTNMVMRSNPVVQDIPPPHQGEYPLCTDGRTNNCINPREAGKTTATCRWITGRASLPAR